MCLTCGCMIPFENHGDPRNLIVADIQDSTRTEQASGLTPNDAVENIKRTWEQKVGPEVKNTRVNG